MQDNELPQLPPDEAPEPIPTEIGYEFADVSTRYEDVYQIVTPDEVTSVRWRDGAYEFICQNGVTLHVQVVTPGIIRLRYSPDGLFGCDFSYALDPDFAPEKVTATLNETETEYLLVSEVLQVVIAKSGMRVRFYDLNDRVLCEDAGGFSAKRTILRGWCDLRMQKKCGRKEAFYGLGDKNDGAKMDGRQYGMW